MTHDTAVAGARVGPRLADILQQTGSISGALGAAEAAGAPASRHIRGALAIRCVDIDHGRGST